MRGVQTTFVPQEASIDSEQRGHGNTGRESRYGNSLGYRNKRKDEGKPPSGGSMSGESLAKEKTASDAEEKVVSSLEIEEFSRPATAELVARKVPCK